jgi:FkbM family methyltransferase
MDPIDRFIRQYVESDSTVLDIGANQGLYARTMLSRGARVYAFEPNPEMAQTLSQNLRNSRLEVVQKAVADRSGTVDFHIDLRPGVGAVASSVHRLDDLDGLTKQITVECTTVDAFCSERGIRPQFIKVDVEGGEREVFAGARQTIARNAPFMVFEFWETWWRRGISDIFEQLTPDYDLVVLGTGEDAYALYTAEGDSGRRAGSVDIGCIPKLRTARPSRGWKDWLLRRWRQGRDAQAG